MRMKVKNCLECEYTKTCRSYYGGSGCKMKVEDQDRKEESADNCNGCFGAANGDCERCIDKWKRNVMKRFEKTN